MTATIQPAAATLLFNDECAVCRTIGHWVHESARRTDGGSRLDVRPIGDDPEALKSLNPELDIWDAYETIHLVMPDGSMLLGGDAVAEVLRDLPNCRWFSWTFAVSFLGMRPFQVILDLGYVLLSDLRPLLGCESCGMPNYWVKHVAALIERMRTAPRIRRGSTSSPRTVKVIA